MLSRVGVVAAVAVVCAAVSSCGLLQAPPAPPPTVESIPPVQTDYTTVTSNQYAKRLGGRYFTDANRGLLVGPHFLIRQQSIGTVTEIGSKTASLLGLKKAVRAPEGYEFVVADFSEYVGYDHDVPAKGKQPGTLPGSKYRPQVLVGKNKSRPLYVNLAGGKLLIVTAPLKSKVLLKMTDAGKTQYLDLRTGYRAKDSVASYYPGRSFGPTRPQDVKKYWRRIGLTVGGDGVVATIRNARAELSPFRPDGTWETSRGQAWLYLTVQVTANCEHVTCSMVLSPGKQIRLRTKGGGTPKAVGSPFRTVSLLKVGSTDGTATYAYKVPASTRSATATVAPSGQLTVQKGKKVSKPRWRVAPKPITLPLSWR